MSSYFKRETKKPEHFNWRYHGQEPMSWKYLQGTLVWCLIIVNRKKGSLEDSTRTEAENYDRTLQYQIIAGYPQKFKKEFHYPESYSKVFILNSEIDKLVPKSRPSSLWTCTRITFSRWNILQNISKQCSQDVSCYKR